MGEGDIRVIRSRWGIGSSRAKLPGLKLTIWLACQKLLFSSPYLKYKYLFSLSIFCISTSLRIFTCYILATSSRPTLVVSDQLLIPHLGSHRLSHFLFYILSLSISLALGVLRPVLRTRAPHSWVEFSSLELTTQLPFFLWLCPEGWTCLRQSCSGHSCMIKLFSILGTACSCFSPSTDPSSHDANT